MVCVKLVLWTRSNGHRRRANTFCFNYQLHVYCTLIHRNNKPLLMEWTSSRNQPLPEGWKSVQACDGDGEVVMVRW